jgi:hypothetical protein
LENLHGTIDFLEVKLTQQEEENIKKQIGNFSKMNLSSTSFMSTAIIVPTIISLLS